MIREQPRWIEFVLLPAEPRRITPSWEVVTKPGPKEVGGVVLGRIAWWSPWRKYAFFPKPNTLYEPVCLRDVATFIDARMQERREARKGATRQ